MTRRFVRFETMATAIMVFACLAACGGSPPTAAETPQASAAVSKRETAAAGAANAPPTDEESAPIDKRPITRGRGWSLRFDSLLAVKEQGDKDLIGLSLADGSRAICAVHMSAPERLLQIFEGVFTPEQVKAMHIGEIQVEHSHARPVLRVLLVTSSIVLYIPVAVLADPVHPVVCVQDNPHQGPQFREATKAVFDGLSWDAGNTLPPFMEVNVRTRRVYQHTPWHTEKRKTAGWTSVTVVPESTTSQQKVVGFDWTAITRADDGTTTVVSKTFETAQWNNDTWYEHYDREVVDAAGLLQRYDASAWLGEGAPVRTSLEKTAQKTYRVAQGSMENPPKHTLKSKEDLLGTTAVDAKLREYRLARTPTFDFSLEQFVPIVALGRATPVRYVRTESDKGAAVSIERSDLKVLGEMGNDGRLDEAKEVPLPPKDTVILRRRIAATGVKLPK